MLAEVKELYDIDQWTYEDFLAFVLMYAGYSDNILKPDEQEAIERMVGEGKASMAKKVINKLNDQEQIELILSFKEKYFATKEAQEKMYADMTKIYHSDGVFNQIERIALMYLKKLI